MNFKKYNSKITYLYPVFFITIAASYFDTINWPLVYLIYSLIYIFGVEIGYHRYLAHHASYNKNFARICIAVGSLAHIGGLQESVVYHLHHHQHSDTEKDHQKTFLTALRPKPGEIKFVRGLYLQPLKRIKNDLFLSWIDKNYYIWLASVLSILLIILKTAFFLQYVILPTSLVLIAHRYGAYLFHTVGYQNYKLPNKSKNSIYLLPLYFGENWHNNHHQFPSFLSNRRKWWEIDFCYILSYPFIR